MRNFNNCLLYVLTVSIKQMSLIQLHLQLWLKLHKQAKMYFMPGILAGAFTPAMLQRSQTVATICLGG